MKEAKLKLIVLTHGGAECFLDLLSKLDNIEIVGVIVETTTEKHRTPIEKLKRSIRYDGVLATITKVAMLFPHSRKNGELISMERGRDDLVKWAQRLRIPVTMVANYHSDDAVRLIREAKADLGILYGTNIVKESVFSIPRLGSVNLHQGLAPFYRGGPTVFWELLNGESEVGITVHFVASAVDTGDIILQTTVPLSYDFARYALNYEEFLKDYRASLKEPSAYLLTEAVRQIADGKHQRTKQDTTIGKRYKLPIKSEKNKLLRILRERHLG